MSLSNNDTNLVVPFANGDAQIVTPSVSDIVANPGDTITFDLEYSTDPQNDGLTGIGINMHYDSSILSYEGAANVLQEGHLGMEVKEDSADLDNDPSTDQLVVAAWYDAQTPASWPNGTLPATLFKPSFTVEEGLTETHINFSSENTALGYEFSATPVTVTANEANEPNNSPNIIFITLNETPDVIEVGKHLLAEFIGNTSGKVLNISDGSGATNIDTGAIVNIEGDSDNFSVSRNGTTLKVDDSDGNLVASMNASSSATTRVQFADGGSEMGVEGTQITYGGEMFADNESVAGGDLELSADLSSTSYFDNRPEAQGDARDMIVITLNDSPLAFSVGAGVIAEFIGDTSGRTITVPQGAGATNIDPGTTLNIEAESEELVFARNGTTLTISDESNNLVAVLNASLNQSSSVRFLDGSSQMTVAGSNIMFGEEVFEPDTNISGDELTLNADDAFAGLSLLGAQLI